MCETINLKFFFVEKPRHWWFIELEKVEDVLERRILFEHFLVVDVYLRVRTRRCDPSNVWGVHA